MSDSDRELKVWMDGELVPKSRACVSVYDHGLLYGDGVFEGVRAYGGRVFEADAHVRRLYESAKAIRLDIPYAPDELHAAMRRAVEANGFSDCYLRLVVTRGVGDLGIDPKNCRRATCFCIADKIRIYPPELYETGMSVITSSVVKNLDNALPPRVKSLNYLNSILAKIEANDAGVPEAIMLNSRGEVAECTADNIFVVAGGAVHTPPTSAGILAGVTRAVVMRLCAAAGIEAHERSLVRHDLYAADEVFLTGTAAEVIGVTKVDNRPIGDGRAGPVAKRLKALFHAHARGETA